MEVTNGGHLLALSPGLPPAEEVRSKFSEDDEVLQLVNVSRAALGRALH